MIELEKISYYLKNLRKQHNYTQVEIANKLHVVPKTYANYETGRRMMPLLTFIKLLKIYGIDIEATIK